MDSVRTGIRILVAEDEPGVRNLISLALKHQGYSADFAEDTVDASVRLHRMGSRYSAVLVDLDSDGNGAELLEQVRRMQPPIPVIGLVDDVTAVADSAELTEVIVKPLSGESLRKAVQKCLSVRHPEQAASDEISVLGAECNAPSSIWRNEMQPLIRHVAASDVPVLVRGETGAGKEVIARQIHALSPRSKKAFLKVNCAALPSELIESELFGYERGAFTGAFKTTPGKFEMAEGGTILLDEIGDMDFKLQAKLLQVLQDSEFIRLGSSEPRRVDVRVIAATHCDLEQAIVENRFREDLYYRLNIITIHVPSLRERRDEVLPLAHHFMRKHATPTHPVVEISPILRDALLSHDWPGNIRELENVIRKLLVVRRPDLVAQEIQSRARRRAAMFVPPPVNAGLKEPAALSLTKPVSNGLQEVPLVAAPIGNLQPFQPAAVYGRLNKIHEDPGTPKETLPYRNGNSTGRPVAMDEVPRTSVLERVDHARREAETEAIISVLNSTLWNRKRAAELLNIDYKALLYKMKKLGIVERAAQVAI
jgi:two-component system, NtrC family, response regulator AtoC